MLLSLSVEDANRFVEDAQTAQTTYYRVRRDLYQKFVDCLKRDAPVRFSAEDFYAIKGFLDCRNDKLDDNKRLAFDKTVVNIAVAASRVQTSLAGRAAHMLGMA